jgi:hypothetical protein
VTVVRPMVRVIATHLNCGSATELRGGPRGNAAVSTDTGQTLLLTRVRFILTLQRSRMPFIPQRYWTSAVLIAHSTTPFPQSVALPPTPEIRIFGGGAVCASTCARLRPDTSAPCRYRCGFGSLDGL